MTIQSKLAAVQKTLKCNKSQYNSFGKYNYRSCEDILESAKPLCIENGLLLTLTDEIVCIGTRYYVKSIATVEDCEDNTKLSVCAYAREEESKKGMDGSQVTGACSSYARKYALNGLFCIDDTKDADTMDNSTKSSITRENKNNTQTNQEKQKTSHNNNKEQKTANKDVPQTVDDYKKMVFGKAKVLDCVSIIPELLKEKYGKKFDELSLVEAKTFYDHLDEMIAAEDKKLTGGN